MMEERAVTERVISLRAGPWPAWRQWEWRPQLSRGWGRFSIEAREPPVQRAQMTCGENP